MSKTVTETIEFESSAKHISAGTKYSDISVSEGLKCEVTGECINDGEQVKMKMKFNYDDEQVEKLTGTVTLLYRWKNKKSFKTIESYVNFGEPGLSIDHVLIVSKYCTYIIQYKYSLTFHRAPSDKVTYDTMFAPSSQNDAVLVIGEKKLHVNKAFLSYHSIHFRNLFAVKTDDENGIPIEDVTFDDFGLLMSAIYPETVSSNHKTAETLLELGLRFKMPAVIHHVENQLFHETRLPTERLMFLADKYGMKKLLRKAIREMNSLEKAKQLEKTAEYSQLSDFARGKTADRLMQLILISTP